MDFSLSQTDGRIFTLSQLQQPLVLFFYPRDNTPGCTVENQDFSSLAGEFAKLGYALYGISRDTLKSHCNFSEKYNLQHQLLADHDETVCNLFGVMKDKTMYGKPVRGIERSTFILNQQHKIIKEWRKVSVSEHAAEVLQFVKNLAVGL